MSGQRAKDAWLKVFCPDGACATGPEHFWQAGANWIYK
jgi:hypothetical protein